MKCFATLILSIGITLISVTVCSSAVTGEAQFYQDAIKEGKKIDFTSKTLAVSELKVLLSLPRTAAPNGII